MLGMQSGSTTRIEPTDEGSLSHTGATVELARTEETYPYNEVPKTANKLSPEQAFAHMMKAMMGTGLLSLPLAFKHAGLWLGLALIIIICGICLYCMRLVVHAAHCIRQRTGREAVDYANVMRSAVEGGPSWLHRHGYFFKQLLNANMFCSQLGFCCVYFVFMSDNIKSFCDLNTGIHLPKSAWMALLLIPILAICSIRDLKRLAPFALAANFLYMFAVAIVIHFFFTHLQPSYDLPAVGHIRNLPLYFGTVLFAFEGVAVVLPIENKMSQAHAFIKWNGVLNSSCLVVLAIFAVIGFYGYLAVGNGVADTVTLNLPRDPFYQGIKILFSLCIMVSYPLQFFVPMERVEKWITRKIPTDRQVRLVYLSRYGLVLLTCVIAEMVPHLALFISLIGAFSGSSMALLFPPFIDLLISYSKGELTWLVWTVNIFLLLFAFVGFTTGTYAALFEIFRNFGSLT